MGIENKIYLTAKKLINNGIIEFYSGGMGNFDKLCEKAVKKLGGKIIFVPYNIKAVKKNKQIINLYYYDKKSENS